MPNGHGGIPHYGSPILYAILFFVAVFYPLAADPWLQWARAALCLLLAALAGWRLAYHLHMWDADALQGYAPEEAYRHDLRRYRVFATAYAVLTTGLGFAILWWRGLP
jgi:hypothetical protein